MGVSRRSTVSPVVRLCGGYRRIRSSIELQPGTRVCNPHRHPWNMPQPYPGSDLSPEQLVHALALALDSYSPSKM